MTGFAIYDMDRTITRAGTYTPWLIFWAVHQAPWRLMLLPVAALFGLAYAAKLITRARLKELNQRLLMGNRIPRDRLAPVAEAYAQKVVDHGSYDGAKTQIAADKGAGRRVLLATASYAFYVDAIARRLGIDEVVATRSHWHEDRLLCRIDDGNCYAAEKLRLLQGYFGREKIDRAASHVTFYSDHISDRPVFEWADEAVATNPSPALRRLAQAKSWRIVDWS